VLIGDLARADLARRLRSEGIHLVTGAFTTQLSIDVPHLVDEFADMYARYPFEAPPGVDDARLRIAEHRPLRRWLRPHVRTWVNGEPLVGLVPAHRAFTALETSLNWSIVVGGSAPLILHAAVMERDGRALIMPAPSGSGKSTLCAALVLRGWRLFSDEATVFGFNDGLLYPNPRPVSLKNTSIDVIRTFEPSAQFSPIYQGTPKGDVAYMRAPEESVARAGEPAVPGLVVTPAYIAGAKISTRTLDKAEGFRMLMDNAVNYASMLQTGFDFLTHVVARCTMLELTYSDFDEAIALIDTLHREARPA
jgi:HprK-related kinase A